MTSVAIDQFFQAAPSELIIASVLLFAITAAALALKLRKSISSTLSLSQKGALLLAIAVAVFTAINLGLGAHHAMYVDEPWYMEAAKNINENGKAQLCEYETPENKICKQYPKMYGWPVILAIAFKLFGASDETAFLASAALSALGIVALFLVAWLLLENEYLAFFSAILLALDPTFLFWSTTAEANAPTLFFALFAILCAIIAIRQIRQSEAEKNEFAILVAAAVFLASSMRSEFILLLALMPPLLLNGSARSFKKISFAALILIGLAAYGLQITALLSAQPQHQELKTPWDVLSSATSNLSVHPAYLLLGALSLAGLASLKKENRGLALAFSAILLLSLPILFSKEYGDQYRYQLPAIASLAVLASFCAFNKNSGILPKILLGILAAALFLHAPTLNVNAIENNSVELLAKSLERNCLIITDAPAIIHASTDFKSISNRYAADRPDVIGRLAETECVVFFEDQYCQTDLEYAEFERCKKIHENFELDEIMAFEGKRPDGKKVIFKAYAVAGLKN